MQRTIAAEKGVVMDGRDIGTTVLPDAELKIYMKASHKSEQNAGSWMSGGRGVDVDLAALTQQIIRRDDLDMNREISPLKKAEDAILLDTSHMGIPEVENTIIRLGPGISERRIVNAIQRCQSDSQRYYHTRFKVNIIGKDRIRPEGRSLSATIIFPITIRRSLLSALTRCPSLPNRNFLREIPVLGFLISRLNAVPVSRGKSDRAALKKSIEVLKEGNALLVFPEGAEAGPASFRICSRAPVSWRLNPVHRSSLRQSGKL